MFHVRTSLSHPLLLGIALLGSTLLQSEGASAADLNSPVSVKRNFLGEPLFEQGGEPVLPDDLSGLLSEPQATQVDRLNRTSQALLLSGALGFALAGEEIVPINGGTLLGMRGAEIWTLVGISTAVVSVAFPMLARKNDITADAVDRHNRTLKGQSYQERVSWPKTWFVRTSLAGGPLEMQEDIAGVQDPPLSVTGTAGAFEWMLGYSIAPGLVLGGGILAASQFGVDASSGDTSLDGKDVALHLTSPLAFAQYYPSSRIGLNFQALGGYAVDLGERDGDTISADASGYLLGAGVGWDFALAPGAAVGIFLRGIYAQLDNTINLDVSGETTAHELKHEWQGAMLGASVTYY